MSQTTKFEQSDARVVYSGAGGSHWTLNTPDANASGGSYSFTSTVGDTATITIPAGNTTVLLVATGRSDASGGTASISVDGVTIGTWDQSSHAAAVDTRLFNYRTTSRPLAVSGSGSTIVLTHVSGIITLDAVECYNAASIVAGRLLLSGHSIPFGYNYNGGVATPTPLTNRIGTSLAAKLGMTLVEQCVPGEDLTNGNFGTANLYPNTYAPMAGWVRAEAGPSFAGSWWNGTGVVSLASIVGGTGYTNGSAITFTGGGIVAGGTPAVATANVTGGAVTGATFSTFGSGYTSPPTVSFTGGTGASATAVLGSAGGSSYSVPARSEWWGQTPEIAVVLHGINDRGYTYQFDLGTAGVTAGVGYTLGRFKQRLRELIWRMMANSPNTLILVGSLTYSHYAAITAASYTPPGGVAVSTDYTFYNGTAAGWPIWPLWNQAIASVCAESTMKNAYFVDLWTPTYAMGGNAWLQDGTHPTSTMDEVIATAFYNAAGAVRNRPASRLGGL